MKFSHADDSDDKETTQIDEEAQLKTCVHLKTVDSVEEVCMLLDSSRFKHILKEFTKFSGVCLSENTKRKLLEIICSADDLTIEIDKENSSICKLIKEIYQKRLPELNLMNLVEMDYARTVKVLRNDFDLSSNEELQKILNPATILQVSEAASTTQGQLLSDQELKIIDEACTMSLALTEIKVIIIELVRSKMTAAGPNLCAIVGATTAAKLVAIAGGLKKLSRLSVCNILDLGTEKKTLEGFSKVHLLSQNGFINHSELVQSVPQVQPDVRKKIAIMTASKIRCATTYDAQNEFANGNAGQNYRKDIKMKIEKLLKPNRPISTPWWSTRDKNKARKMLKRLSTN